MNVKELLRKEADRSGSEYTAYMPGHWDGSTNDTLNVHFLVFDGPDGSLMGVWVQSDLRNEGNDRASRIMFSRSMDDGKTWSDPSVVTGPKRRGEPDKFAAWEFPLVSKSGRIYIIYSENPSLPRSEWKEGKHNWVRMHAGWMSGVYSDDNGITWSKPERIQRPQSPYDDPSGEYPGEWLVWQNAVKDKQGRYLVTYTHWVNPAVSFWKPADIDLNYWGWTEFESVVEVMRFNNIDSDPEPRDLVIDDLAWGDTALRVPHWYEPRLSVAQEPSIVRLPDERLMLVMRTNSGMIWYSLSSDDGEHWCNPRALLDRDHGRPLLQPVICCPLYRLSDGRYALMYHNNRGDLSVAEGKRPNTANPRSPAYLALGEYRAHADQPIWFSEPKLFLDNGQYAINGEKFDPLTPERMRQWNDNIGVYGSFSSRNGEDVIWHADRKSFLLGKRVTKEFLAGMTVPTYRYVKMSDTMTIKPGV